MPYLDLIPASGIRKIFDRASELEGQGKRILHLEIGRPDFDSPSSAKAAVMTALNEGRVHYTENRGIPKLRRLIAEKLRDDNNLHYDPESEIVVTNGTSEGVAMAMAALAGPGDEVIVPTPSWSHYVSCATLFGATPVELALKADNDYQLTREAVEKLVSERTRVLVVNTPNNPSGAVYPEKELRSILELCLERSIYILSDEIYDYFCFGGERHVSIAALPNAKPICVVANGFSKTYSMTGWRLGYVASSAEIAAKLNKAHQYLTVCANSFAQHGACAALADDEGRQFLEKMTESFERRWRITNQLLSEIKCLRLPRSAGAFYAFPSFDYKGMSADQLCAYLLEEGGVATVPGTAFGEAHKDAFRIAYSVNETELAEALTIIKNLLA
ncbi:MAG: pyridoxal phosphate-dependent aminotransferase [Deltaproteobacteria bacterium]|nr:pyridoxal phosphate-dependent aminotransferase [Deltaproteobacteria bacterium]